MIKAYNDQCINVGKTVQIEQRGEISTGVCKAVLPNGGLEVKVEGHVKTIHSGEVSVRGLYGYID